MMNRGMPAIENGMGCVPHASGDNVWRQLDLRVGDN